MKRWGHGHSMAAGIAGGLLLAGHTLELITIALVAGVIIGRVWRAAAAAGELLAERLHSDRVPSMPGRGGASSRRPGSKRKRGGFDWDDAARAFDEAARRGRVVAGAIARKTRWIGPSSGVDDGIPF